MPKQAIVTGGTAGIGRELVAQLSDAGWEVHSCGRDPEALAALRTRPGVHASAVDLGDPHAVDAWGQEVLRATRGRISLLVLNAGVQIDGAVEQRSPASIAGEIAVNLTAPALLTARLWPALEAERGAIVYVSSGLALVPRTDAPLYSASKAGLSSFAAGLRRRSGRAVTVTDVLLPMVDTGMTAGRDGMPKLSPGDAARGILAAAGADRRVALGRARSLPFIVWAAPPLARRIIR